MGSTVGWGFQTCYGLFEARCLKTPPPHEVQGTLQQVLDRPQGFVQAPNWGPRWGLEHGPFLGGPWHLYLGSNSSFKPIII